MAYILPVDTPDPDLEMVGGKGRSLAKLTEAGFAVPAGFIVTTDAYKALVSENDLQAKILKLARPALVSDAVSFEQASRDIHELSSRPKPKQKSGIGRLRNSTRKPEIR